MSGATLWLFLVAKKKKKKKSLSGFFQGLSSAGHLKFMLSFIIISAKPPLTHIEIFLVDYMQIACMVVVCNVCWKSITIAHAWWHTTQCMCVVGGKGNDSMVQEGQVVLLVRS